MAGEGARPVRTALRQLLGDSLVYGMGRVAGNLVGLVLLPVYTHHMVVEDYGLLDNLFVLAMLLGSVVPLGLPDAVQRFWFLAKGDEDRRAIVGSALAAATALLLVAVPVLILFAPEIVRGLFGVDRGVAALRLAALTLVPATLMALAFAVLRARFQSVRFGIASVFQVVLLGGVNTVLVAGYGMGITGVFLGGLAAATATAALALWFARDGIRARFSAAWLRSMFAYSVPLVPSFVAFWALSYADRWLLLRLEGLHEAGLYSTGAKIAGILLLLNFAILTAFPPVALRIADRPEAKRFFARALTGYVCIASCVAVAFTAGAREIVGLLTPPEYLDGHRAVLWLTVGFVFAGMSPFVSIGLHIVRRTHHVTWIAVVAAVLNIALNLLLIPLWGMLGAAAATALSYAAMTGLYAAIGRRIYPIEFENSRLLRVALVFAAALGAVSLLSGPGLGRIAARWSIAAAFPVALLLVRAIRGWEIRDLLTRVREGEE